MTTAVQSGKLLHDPIHGHIHLSDDLVCVIDTPHFQRLRDLKQLGTSYFVFPGACHNRFEHSIGVAHLAAQLIDHLTANQPELHISPKERFLVTLSGLCHDLGQPIHHTLTHALTPAYPTLPTQDRSTGWSLLRPHTVAAFSPHSLRHRVVLRWVCHVGHGPFSHVFDSEFIPQPSPLPSRVVDRRLLPSGWHHEQASIMMTEDMLAAAGRQLDEADLQFVKELIDPTSYPTRSNPKQFLYDIVANARNSLDVDKVTQRSTLSINTAPLCPTRCQCRLLTGASSPSLYCSVVVLLCDCCRV